MLKYCLVKVNNEIIIRQFKLSEEFTALGFSKCLNLISRLRVISKIDN
ncbi:hypothetical protein BMETH_470_0 [methanotrophic bacterial endosymbiont of Bathymodiolus sp.]|nr:hypothetical protein BMETH_470_0 [methanotrophic bacterial endosymbiont of Bathymodiolus sp.]